MPEQSPADSVQERLTAFFGNEATPAPQAPAQAPEEAPQAVQAEEEAVDTPEEADDGQDELDIDGLVLKVPREAKAKISEWKEGALRREDYTRKTQELADITRQAQLTAEAIQQRQQFETEVAKERSEYASITSQLEQYKQVPWGELDVNQYIKLKGQMDTLKDRAEELKGSLNTKAQEFQGKIEGQKQKAIHEGQKFLQKVIPNLNADTIKSARGSAMELGYTESELDNVYDARFVALAWKAAQYDKLQSSKTSAVASVQKAPPIVKPGATVPGAAAENKYRELRAQQRKSGSLADTTRLLMTREK